MGNGVLLQLQHHERIEVRSRELGIPECREYVECVVVVALRLVVPSIRDNDEYEYEYDDGGMMCNMRDYWTGVESYYYQDDDDGDDNDVEEEETTAKFVENRCGMEGACRPGTSSIRTTRYYARRTNPRWSTSRTSNRRPWT